MMSVNAHKLTVAICSCIAIDSCSIAARRSSADVSASAIRDNSSHFGNRLPASSTSSDDAIRC